MPRAVLARDRGRVAAPHRRVARLRRRPSAYGRRGPELRRVGGGVRRTALARSIRRRGGPVGFVLVAQPRATASDLSGADRAAGRSTGEQHDPLLQRIDARHARRRRTRRHVPGIRRRSRTALLARRADRGAAAPAGPLTQRTGSPTRSLPVRQKKNGASRIPRNKKMKLTVLRVVPDNTPSSSELKYKTR